MAFWDRVRAQLRSVIEWDDPQPDDLFYRWTDNGDEIKNASKLIVKPGQGCIFVYEGKVRSVHTQEGMTDLRTANIPFWTTITKVMQSFESEHKVGIYFFRMTKILDQKWGTSSVIKYDDPKYNFPVGLRAFGNYSVRISEPREFFVNVVGDAARFSISDLRSVMTDRIAQPLTDYLAVARLSYADIDAKREEIAGGIHSKLGPVFEKIGFQITDFRIEGTSFDEDTMRRINRIADTAAEAQAANKAGINYTQMQQLDAMRDAARNEGGAAGIGMGVGAGIGFGNMMAGAMGGREAVQADDGKQSAAGDPVEALKKLKQMLEMELITEEEFSSKKQQILGRM